MNNTEINLILSSPHIAPEIKAMWQYKLRLNLIVTNDPRMLELKRRVELLHDRTESVLILGESGTGKELIAHALHGNRKGLFIKINCSGLPSELIESELFGHTKGAFTGAVDNRVGKLVAAKDGSIFLDEIGDMPIPMQAKLLRALDAKEVTPLGSNTPIPVNCRIISATNKSQEIYDKKQFRLDLLHRIGMFVLHTTPYRERRGDIHELIDALYDVGHKIPPQVREIIANMDLYGNAREIESLCLNYIVFSEMK